ncbi:NmrA family NAD(P)-binding protein [Amycolatopsis sp. NPDC021455]|uniref:NmrA family NAD(P)-binding protein n=1 Tax=Amycolatopsis sp. NPDC021455 TaxID=3154901 RepID=UPI003403F2AB
MRERGAEVVKADLSDEASLRVAFEGVDAAYLVTNWAELMDPKAEIDQVHAMARAAKAAGVGHAIWSTLEDTAAPDSDRRPTGFCCVLMG